MELTAETCYRALTARDARFDGVFFVGVTSTKIYCRPVCTVRPPRCENCRFFAHAALAEREGFRPCLRCRPELAPGHAPVDAVGRIARLAAARIEAGALHDGGSLEQLGRDLGVGVRQLRRAVRQEFGVSPVELAQTNRLLLAKRLLTESDLPVIEVAFASGFGSVRRFNALFRSHYGLTPTEVRRGARPRPAADGLRLTLAYRPPFAWEALLGFLAGRATAGVECVTGGSYARTARLGRHCGWFQVTEVPGKNALAVELSTSLTPALAPLLARLRNLFDLSARPDVIDAHLAGDPVLAGCVSRLPGLRVPGAFDGFELAVRAVLGQRISVRAATTLAGRLAASRGEPLETPYPCLNRLSPTAERLAKTELSELTALGLPATRAACLQGLARAAIQGRLGLEPGSDPRVVTEQLQRLPGIGAWTAQYVALRALRWPDAFPDGDLGLLKASAATSARELSRRAESWRPWRAYAAMHLWKSLDLPREVNANGPLGVL